MSETLGLHGQLTMDAGNFSAEMSKARNVLAKFAVEERQLRTEISKAESELSKQTKKFGKDSEEAKKAANALQELYRKNLELKDSVKQTTDGINKQTAAFAKNAEQGNNTANQLKNSFTMLKGLIVGYAGKTLFEALIGSNAQFEQYMTSFDVLLGGADKAQKMMEDIEEFAAKTPLQMDDVSKATQLLLSYGVAQEDVMTRMRQLGDLSQGNAEKLDRVSLAYGQMLAKGKVTGEELRQMTEAGVPLVQSLADVMGISTAELSKMLETGSVGIPELNKAIEAMTSEGGKFFNMLEKQSKTMTGMWSTLTDEVNIFARNVGEESFEYLKGELNDLMNTISQMKESGELDAIAADLGQDIANAITFIGNLVKWLYEMKDVLITVAGAAVSYKLAIQGLSVIQTIINWTQTWITTLNSLKAVKAAGITYSTLYKAAMLGESTSIAACTAAGIKDIAVKGTQVAATNSATGATLSFNAALMKNPIVAVVGLIGLLVGGLVTYISTTKEAANETDHLTENLSNMESQIRENEKATLDEIDAVEKTIPRLDELSKKTNLTSGEKKELEKIIENLNRVIPDLELAIDGETGALNRQISTIYAAIDAYRELAKAKALQELSTESYKEMYRYQTQASNTLAGSKDKVAIINDVDKIYTEWKKENPHLNENAFWLDFSRYAPEEYKDLTAEDIAKMRDEVKETNKEYNELNQSASNSKKDAENYDSLYEDQMQLYYDKLDINELEETSYNGPGSGTSGSSGASGSSSASTATKEPVYKELAYTYPFDQQYPVSSGGEWGAPRGNGFHDALDYAAPMGTPVKAANAGTVIFAGWADGYGNYIEIDHGNGDVTTYGHLSAINVSAGQTVGRGEKIGEVGSTGNSTGPHLDFRFRRNGVSLDPNGLFTGEYGSVLTQIEDAGSTAEDDYDRVKEQQRRQKISDFKKTKADKMSSFERKMEQDLAYGYITEEEYIEAIKTRENMYSQFAEEVMELDYMTVDEKLEILSDYYQKAGDLALEYYEKLKAYEKDNLNFSIQQSEKWIEERKENNDWGDGDNEAKAWGRVLERVKKYYNEDFYNPNQAREYLSVVSDLEDKIRTAMVSDVQKTIDEVSALKKSAYEKEQEEEKKRIEKQFETTESALNRELEMVKKGYQTRMDYLDKLKKERSQKKEDEEDKLDLERLQTKLEYENDEGNIKSLQREINALNEEIEDKEFNRWIEAEKEKASIAQEIEIEKINAMIEKEQNRKMAMIDYVTEYYTEKMTEASLALESSGFIDGFNTLKQMNGLFDTIDYAGVTFAVSELVGMIERMLGEYGTNGTTVINNYKTDNSTTNVSSSYQLKDLSPSQLTKAKKQSLEEYMRNGYVL